MYLRFLWSSAKFYCKISWCKTFNMPNSLFNLKRTVQWSTCPTTSTLHTLPIYLHSTLYTYSQVICILYRVWNGTGYGIARCGTCINVYIYTYMLFLLLSCLKVCTNILPMWSAYRLLKIKTSYHSFCYTRFTQPLFIGSSWHVSKFLFGCFYL